MSNQRDSKSAVAMQLNHKPVGTKISVLTHATALGCSANPLSWLNLWQVNAAPSVCKVGYIKGAIETVGLIILLKEY